MPPQPTRIDRIYFLIHPVCWGMHGGGIPSGYQEATGCLASEWYAALSLERQVNQKQMEFIEAMGPNEALIIFPISQSKPMLDLIATAERVLGPRCLIPECPLTPEPAVLKDMSEPIRHFLDDEEMEGRDAYWNPIPESLRPVVEQEIRDACEALGYDWNPAALKVVGVSRLAAVELTRLFEERGLIIDPETLTAEAFGEGFEQCAMTWKLLLPDYLGWRNPVRNIYDLSVSGQPVLFDAQFKERIDLDNRISLFLWEKWHGLPMAFLQRAAERFADPRHYANLPVDDGVVEVWEARKPIWPAKDSPLSAEDGILRVPVKTGSRKYYSCDACYLLGASYTYDQFRTMLLSAEITTD